MAFQLRYFRHELQFKFDARTSRGSLTTHTAFYLILFNAEEPEIKGYGEVAPLAGLSIDFGPDLEGKIAGICRTFSDQNHTDLEEAKLWLLNQNLGSWPALKFGLETALLDYANGGRQILFNSEFTRGKSGIPINGLIWMGDENFMRQQIEQKLTAGYNVLKLKIGGLDFTTELAILKAIREVAGPETLTIRLDANGAFKPDVALAKLEQLAAFEIHSIEQPIKPNQPFAMRNICAKSPIPVALDEELIGVADKVKRKGLLQYIKPQFIILKPTLVGGLTETRKWIELAEKQQIGWWLTSALESNIGLNAIAQFTATFVNLLPQGLGTGQLYHNNIPSPLIINHGNLYYNSGQNWEINAIIPETISL